MTLLSLTRMPVETGIAWGASPAVDRTATVPGVQSGSAAAGMRRAYPGVGTLTMRIFNSGLSVVLWLVLCASLALVWGSGARRYLSSSEPDSMPLFYAGAALFFVAAAGSLWLRATGGAERRDNSVAGILFLSGTALAAIVVGVVLDATN